MKQAKANFFDLQGSLKSEISLTDEDLYKAGTSFEKEWAENDVKNIARHPTVSIPNFDMLEFRRIMNDARYERE